MGNITDLKIKLKVKLSKHLFWEFCLFMDEPFFNDRLFLKDCAEAMQWVLNEYRKGVARNITISLPPRSGKSYLTSLFCAFWIGQFPELAVMRNCSTADLYDQLSGDTRKIVLSEKYQLIFPSVKLVTTNLSGWATNVSKKVSYFGAGTGGQIQGMGANLAIYDDLYRNLEDALNENANEKVQRWKYGDHNSRKELNCPEIGIGTRWRKNDIIGKEIEKGNVDKVFKQSALVLDAEKKEWQSFCEKVNTTSFYLNEKKNSEESWFDAMYMQNPMDAKGLLFPLSELRTYDPSVFDPSKQDNVIILGAIDPADKGGDFHCAIAGYLIGKEIYIPDIVCNTDGVDINEDRMFMFIRANNIFETKFEGNGAWHLMAKNIRAKLGESESNSIIRIFNNSAQKHTRILAQSAFIKNYFVFRNDWDLFPEYRAFMKNLTGYMKEGNAKHDDAPDNAAELMKFFREYLPQNW